MTNTHSASSAPLRWGIIGAGKIAIKFATGLRVGSTGVLQAVAARELARAEAFAAAHGAHDASGASPTRAYGSYDELLADADVDAVYVATLHPSHHDLAVRAAQAGKHVLVEKPLAVNAAWTTGVLAAAERHGVTVAEAFMYRFHPRTARLAELISAGTIGDVVAIEASFAFAGNGDPTSRLLDPAAAGGGILDVGGYPVSMVRRIAGAATGAPFADPVEVDATGTTGPTGVDEWAVANLRFASGIRATVSTGVRVAAPNDVRVFGRQGYLVITDPWLPDPTQPAVIEVRRVGEEPERVEVAGVDQYGAEADAFAAAVRAGRPETEQMSWADSVGNARVLDQWRAAVGVRYPFEATAAAVPVLGGGSGGVRRPAADAVGAMPYGRLPGLDKDVSRLVMGVDNQRDPVQAAVMFDDFVARGGTAFDTAHIYGGGACEATFGAWVAARGVRDEIVVLGKGVHTPHNDPASFRPQLEKSLERLQTDHLDVYLPHRDNPAIPVGEFVDAFDEAVRDGLVTVLGASNWTPQRFAEANDYARRNGRAPFVGMSNHFGLARAQDVVWAGCEHVTDPASRAWLEQTGTALLPWSSQSRGFFFQTTDDPAGYTDPDLVRCYHNPDNVERRHRALQLAAERDVPVTAVALAYVLAQPFPTFPLIGPRTPLETSSSMQALALHLSDDDVAWLDLRLDR